jgi:hypothetical protein
MVLLREAIRSDDGMVNAKVSVDGINKDTRYKIPVVASSKKREIIEMEIWYLQSGDGKSRVRISETLSLGHPAEQHEL